MAKRKERNAPVTEGAMLFMVGFASAYVLIQERLLQFFLSEIMQSFLYG